MSKAHDPHWRYVALKLTGSGCHRGAMGSAVKQAAKYAGIEGDLPQLTRFDWPHAIVKMHHHHVPGSKDWLPAMRAPGLDAVETLSTSGTIKALTERLGVLVERGPKGGPKDAKPVSRSKSNPQARPAAAPARAGTPSPGGAVAPPSRRRDHRG